MFVGLLLPLAVVAVGFFLIIRLKGFFILHPKKTVDRFFSNLGRRESRRALTLALAGTLGVGNIFGVSAGIILGGAGCVFWLLVSSLFSCVIKYSEAALSFDSRMENHGGMHRVIDASLRRPRHPVSVIYASLCLLLALFMGSALQSLAVVDVSDGILGECAPLLLLSFVIFVIIGCRGGVGKIEKVTELVIPLTTVVYILLCIFTLIVNFRTLPTVLYDIITSAMTPTAIGGGALSFFTSRALYEGFARGILSNEAGIGTSSMSHSRGDFPSAHDAGLFAMCEVFFDSVVLCTLTALAILSAKPSITGATTPMQLISDAFRSSLGDLSVIALTLLVILFAYSTVICWYYYGDECREYLFLKKGRAVYSVLFISFSLLSSVFDERLLLFLTDNIILIMAIITLTVLSLLSGRIARVTRERDVSEKIRGCLK